MKEIFAHSRRIRPLMMVKCPGIFVGIEGLILVLNSPTQFALQCCTPSYFKNYT
jgi:hypothetical protein